MKVIIYIFVFDNDSQLLIIPSNYNIKSRKWQKLWINHGIISKQTQHKTIHSHREIVWSHKILSEMRIVPEITLKKVEDAAGVLCLNLL